MTVQDAQRGDFDSPPADDAISLERLIRRIRLDNPAIPRDLGPAAGMWAQSVTEVQVTYHREPGHERGDWLTDEVTLVGSDGALMQREVDTRQRGHRTEGVFATLRWRRKPRLSRWDLGLETLPAWLDELVEAYRPPARSAAIAELKPAPGTDSSGQAVQRVLDLHQRAHETGPTSCVECNKGRKFVPWPCATYRAVAGPQRDHDEEGACAPDCDERADCPDVSSPGHSQCGRRPDGTPRHHPQRDHAEEA